jgi:hypothetical protein
LRSSWHQSFDPDTYYVKLDDDIVFIQDGAIEQMVAEKMRGRCSSQDGRADS